MVRSNILMIVFLSASVAMPSRATEFGSPVAYSVGTSPQSVVVGDFNHDGKLDLAVLNTVSNNVSILLGNGDGTFQTAKNFAAGSNPSGLGVGDFNGDGKLDLAVFLTGNSSTPTGAEIRILLGNGDGSFQAPVVTTLMEIAATFAVGDFNGDKKSDIVVGFGTGTSTFQLFLGNGDGTFQAAKAISVSGAVSPQVAVADFNKDGKLDLAVNGPNGIVVLEGLGDGTFQAGAGSTPLSIGTAATFWTADLNNDGNVDLIVNSTKINCSVKPFHICSTTQNIGVLLGDGKGSFAQEQVFASGSSFTFASAVISSLVIGDFNGDGTPDIAYRSGSETSPMNVRLGKGDGTFAPAILFSETGPVAAAADLKGDKLSDVITLDPNNGNANVLLNVSPGTGADLGLISTGAGPEPVGEGESLTYTADILNEGPANATGVTFKDTLPGNVSLVSATASQGACANSGQVVTCTIGALADAQDATVRIVVTPTMAASISNTMDAAATEPDLAMANNSATQNSTVVPVYTLTVTKTGNVPGTVTTSGISPQNNGNGSINCGNTCSAKFLSGTQVTLDAGVDIGNFFIGWGGACTGNGSCVITMSGDQNISANFAKGNILSVTLAGSGAGAVEDQNVAIFVCTSTNGDCAPALLPGSTISIQAIPSGNSVFGGWSGACTGSDPNVCSVTMSDNEAVTATFNPPPDFTITPTLSNLTLAAGTKTSETLSFAAQGSFSAAIALSCSVSGTAPMPSCGISPNSVNPGKSATLTVDATGVSLTALPSVPWQWPSVYPTQLALAVLTLIMMAAMDRKRRRAWLLTTAALTLSVFPAACGGGSSTPPPPVTKNYRVTVSASSGALQHSTTISVTVN